MFSLEIYNQLVAEDVTKGYSIAGTGTISPDGTVGPIGGIEQKSLLQIKQVQMCFARMKTGKRILL